LYFPLVFFAAVSVFSAAGKAGSADPDLSGSFFIMLEKFGFFNPFFLE